jgi:hypothetical protein
MARVTVDQDSNRRAYASGDISLALICSVKFRSVSQRKYGHSLVAIDQNRLIVFGGVTAGGYMGDINHTHFLTITTAQQDEGA